MNAGTMKYRIEIWRKTSVPDSMGGRIETLAQIDVRWGAIDVPRSRDNILAMQGVELRTHVITLRDKPEYPVKDDILKCAAGTLRVQGVRPDPNNRCVYVDCVSDKP